MSRPATISEILETTAARDPDAAALPGLTWAATAAAVRRIAGGLAKEGIGPGDRVALFLPNGPAILLLLAALARRGACAVLLNTRFRAAEIAPILGRTRPCAIALSRDFAPADASAVLAAVPVAERASLRIAIAADDHGEETFLGMPVRPLAALQQAVETMDAGTPDSECLTFTTSGTTSGPKLVLHRQRSIAIHAQDVATRIGMEQPRSALLAAVPLCGTFGLTAAMAALAAGAAIVPMERFDPVQADALIRERAITHLVGGDDMLLMLADAARQPYAPLRFTGFANFHGRAERVMEESARLGLAARAVYGSSEAQALFALQDPGSASAHIGGGIPASARAGFTLASDGELLLRGPSMFDSYLGDPDATARAWTPEGWFRTGDLASVHADGRGFDFVTRSGDVLRLGGFLVAPEEIETFLLAQPGVTAVQVVAHEGRAVAFVIPGAAFREASTLEACRANLARFKVPSRIVTLAAFPITDGPNGRKVQRAKLREMAAGG